MIKIKGVEFGCKNDFTPNHSAESNDYIKEDKQIASDNIQVNPVSITANIMYVGEDFIEKIEFLENLLYARELFTVEDEFHGREYKNMFLEKLDIATKYKNGFMANISCKYIPITRTAQAGVKTYSGYTMRNINTVQKPLKTLELKTDTVPEITLNSLKEIGIEPIGENIITKSLDFNFDNFSNLGGLSDRISSTIGGFTGIFELSPEGILDILDSSGNYISIGQRLVSGVELLANTIPGVDISLKILPIVQKASGKVFEMDKLGKDFIFSINEIKNNLGGLDEELSKNNKNYFR